MKTSQKILKLSRKIHLYIGVFTAPALLFFAFTGAVQTFSLHETTQGSNYTPPKWLAELGQLHKKQTTLLPVRKSRPAFASGNGPQSQPADNRPGSAAPNSSLAPDLPGTSKLSGAKDRAAETAPVPSRHLPMKIFFLGVAIGLAVSTLSGVYMAWRYTRPLLVIGLLLAGVVIPCMLLGF